MKIIAHRGEWNSNKEQNTLASFERALKNGFGLEVDIRMKGSTLLISHDHPDANSLSLEKLLELYISVSDHKNHLIAFNIKEDGLADALSVLIQKFNLVNYACFDMSIPDTFKYKELQLNFFTRLSEYENSSELFNDSIGIVVDEFNSTWWKSDELEHYKKPFFFISSELHKRDHKAQWEKIKTLELLDEFHLCTDLVHEAKEFFGK